MSVSQFHSLIDCTTGAWALGEREAREHARRKKSRRVSSRASRSPNAQAPVVRLIRSCFQWSTFFFFVLLYSVAEMYLLYLNTPYYKFVRDTLSYIVLLVLHFALCLTPSTIALSGIEWTILVFFVGRFLVECKQIWGIVQRLKRRKEKKGDRDGDDGGRNDEDDGAQSSCLKILSIYLR